MSDQATQGRDSGEIMTLAQVCDLLHVSPNTAYSWRSAGTGPPGFRVGNRVRYRRSDVDAWIAEQLARSA
jgi:excisionase family DNA binding protein